MKVITIAEFLTELNLSLIHDKDEEVSLDMDVFEFLELLGVVEFYDE